MEVNEHVIGFASNSYVPVPFSLEPNEDVLVTISNRKGEVAEVTFEQVKFEGFAVPGEQGKVDMLYTLKAQVPYTIEGKKRK